MQAIDLLVEIIKEQAPEDIWQGSPILGYRLLGNTNRGEVGEKFIIRYLAQFGISAISGANRTARTDIQIGEVKFEVKTASLGANAPFNTTMLDWTGTIIFCSVWVSARKRLFILYGAKGKSPRVRREHW